ncbi:MAG: hypothetical protein SVT52_06305 [Planctomycetota bacterium]|nr:hypothetical protein [Planctomycetota bacterium]
MLRRWSIIACVLLAGASLAVSALPFGCAKFVSWVKSPFVADKAPAAEQLPEAPLAASAGAKATPAASAGAGNEEFARLLLDRPPVPLTRPRDWPGPPRPEAVLPPEGSMVVNRRCRMKRDRRSGWVLLTFEHSPSAGPGRYRWALPNALLEAMERLSRQKPKSVFRVSGETTVYEQQCYILLTKVTVIGPSAVRAEPAKATTGAAATRPEKPEKKTASPEDIMQQLLADRPGQPVAVPATPSQSGVLPVPSVAPKSSAADLPPGRGTLVVDRLVRVVPTGVGRWLQVRFESDNTLREPPLRILPNGMLTEAREIVAEAVEDRVTVRLRVSGEVALYKGRRYVLLRKIFRERDLGQF